MPLFEKLTKRNAQEYFDAYLAHAPAALEQFKQELSQQSGIPITTLNCSPESLIPLWQWLYPRLQGAQHADNLGKDGLPLWYGVELGNNPSMPGVDFTPETLHWIDGLAYYFAEVFIKNIPGAHWSICADSKAVHYNKPVIETNEVKGVMPGIQPVHKMIVATSSAIDKLPKNHGGRLLEVYNFTISGW